MKYILTILFLFLAFFCARGQAIQEQEQLMPLQIEDTLKNSMQAAREALKETDSTVVGSAKNKAKGIVRDSLQNAIAPVVESADFIKLPKSLKSLSIDSTLIDQPKPAVQQIAEDSLNNYIAIPDITPDSTIHQQISSEAKIKAKAIAEKEVGAEIPDLTMDSTIVDQVGSEVKEQIGTALQNETGTEIPAFQIDSTITGQVKSEAKAKAKGALEKEAGIDIPDIAIDSITSEAVKDEVVRRTEGAVKETREIKALDGIEKNQQIDDIEDYKTKFEKSQEELKQAAAQKEIKKKMANHARQYIAKNADKIQAVQSEMSALKQKYSQMPNSNDLSSAVKRTSLKGESLWKRLVIGGNFNISRSNPLTIDLSPVLGYKLNKLSEIGVSGAYRQTFKKVDNSVNTSDPDVYGFSLFANHMIYRNFFGYLEGERMRMQGVPKNPLAGPATEAEGLTNEWKHTMLIGIGRKFNVAKWLEMQAMFLVNVLHDNQDGLYNNRVVFKTGIRLRK